MEDFTPSPHFSPRLANQKKKTHPYYLILVLFTVLFLITFGIWYLILMLKTPNYPYFSKSTSFFIEMDARSIFLEEDNEVRSFFLRESGMEVDEFTRLLEGVIVTRPNKIGISLQDSNPVFYGYMPYFVDKTAEIDGYTQVIQDNYVIWQPNDHELDFSYGYKNRRIQRSLSNLSKHSLDALMAVRLSEEDILIGGMKQMNIDTYKLSLGKKHTLLDFDDVGEHILYAPLVFETNTSLKIGDLFMGVTEKNVENPILTRIFSHSGKFQLLADQKERFFESPLETPWRLSLSMTNDRASQLLQGFLDDLTGIYPQVVERLLPDETIIYELQRDVDVFLPLTEFNLLQSPSGVFTHPDGQLRYDYLDGALSIEHIVDDSVEVEGRLLSSCSPQENDDQVSLWLDDGLVQGVVAVLKSDRLDMCITVDRNQFSLSPSSRLPVETDL